MKNQIICWFLAAAFLLPLNLVAAAARSPGSGPAGSRIKQAAALDDLREAQHKDQIRFHRDQRQAEIVFLGQLAGNKKLTKNERQQRIKEFHLRQKTDRTRLRGVQQTELSTLKARQKK
jgi:hypothetical protein